MRVTKIFALSGSLAIAGAATISQAAITIDGTLDSAYGTALAVQTQASNAADFEGGDPHRNDSDVQLSNAYGYIDTANGKLDLFLGGAVNMDNERLILAFDANPLVGVANLAASTSIDTPANLANTVFDAGFRPERLIQAQFNGGNIFYDTNLLTNTTTKDNYGADPRGGAVTRGPASGDPAGGLDFTVADDTSNESDVGTKISSNFGSVNKGIEFQFDLAELGYVAGSPINVAAFFTYGNNNHLTNQVLGPTSNTNEYDFDFTNATDHPGNQFFTVTPAPEPASIGLLGLVGITALRRRSR